MQDNLYYAILDIVDSLILASGHKHMAAFGRQLKNSLYLCASAEPIGFLEKLAVFGFPNISPEKVRPFCEFLESALLCFPDVQSEAPSPEDQFFAETLRQMIRASSRTESLELLKDSPPDTLVHDFSAHYQQVCLFFPGATHCLDDETHISMDLVVEANYRFADSRTNRFIQLSDVWVGLLSRCFRFLDKWAVDRNPNVFVHNPNAQNNLKTIKRLIDRSTDLHPALISSLEPDCVLVKRAEAFDALCEL